MRDINSTFIKISIIIVINKFTHLCNLVIETGIFPDKWKIASDTAIPKMISNPKS